MGGSAWDLFKETLQGKSPSRRNVSADLCLGHKIDVLCGGFLGAGIDMDEGDDCVVQTLGILDCITCKDAHGRGSTNDSDIPSLFRPQNFPT